MSSEHIKTRRKIKSLEKIELANILDRLMLTENEAKMMRMHYIERKDFNTIADTLGYSEIGIIKMHSRIVKMMNRIL